MTTVPPSPAIASRPRHAPLVPRPCGAALMVADQAGAAALLTLAGAAPGIMSRTTVLLCAAGGMAGAIRAQNPARLVQIASTAELPAALDAALRDARMGLHMFLAGSEGLIGQARAIAMAAGLPAGAIQSEHRGTMARRMQCVHCKTIAEEVATDPYDCPGCGRALFVRDHFSRRIGAFQGVCVDAETPGERPRPVEIRA